MTKNSAMKKAVRARVAATGEKYTEALRAVKRGADDGGRWGPGRPLAQMMRPGSVVAIVSGGGATNTGLVLPELIALRDAGHPVVIAAHDSGRGLADLPSPLDFAYVSGLADGDRIEQLLRAGDTDALVALDAEATRSIQFLVRPLPAATWLELLTPGEDGHAPVLWVQDIQTDAPLSDWPRGRQLSEFDQIPIQLSGLVDLARESGAIVAVGHCSPADFEAGWRVVAEIAPYTVVIAGEMYNDPVREARRVHLRLLDGGGRDETVPATIDTTFFDWRSALR